ncbi:uncharacterized protein [Henckelia pumila]|uniref:uncharacterized protein n=1 Tax=Henckelia pumila TaxID=405737 RepID=UPI003C6E4916
MNCLIWNIRGLGNPDSQRFLEALLKVHKVKIVSILEPMIQLEVRYMTRKFNFCRVLSNCTGKIWAFLSEEIGLEIFLDHPQFLHLKLSAPFLPTVVFCSFVYTSCDSMTRKELWDFLLQVQPQADPWLLGGDFNVVRSANECLGTSSGRLGPIKDFKNFIVDSSLVDPGFVGYQFTWTNKTIWKRLDRVLASPSWSTHFSSIKVEHLCRSISDQCPLLVFAPTGIWGPSSFRFQHMWTCHPGFIQIVCLNWNLPCSLRGMHKIFAKLKRLKVHLKWWNKEVFGNLFEKLAEAEKSVHDAESAILANPSESSRAHLSACNTSLTHISKMKLDFWKQKAACSWLADGERNTKLFHNAVRKKRVTNKIFRILEDGVCLSNPEDICRSGCSLFENLLTGDPFVHSQPDFGHFTTVVSEDDNRDISALPSIEEVRSIVFSISMDSVAGPDGFSFCFYQRYWEFIQ